MEQTRTRALCPRTPMDVPDAVVGLALGLSDGTFPLAARVACMQALVRMRRETPGAWYRCVVMLLRGVGMRLFGTPLSGCSVRVRDIEITDKDGKPGPANDPRDGAWLCAPEGQQPRLGLERWHWGDVPDDVDDASLEWCGIDSSVSSGAAAIVSAACADAVAAYEVVRRIATGSAEVALRHMFWSARAIERMDGADIVELARAIAHESELQLEDTDDWLIAWWCERL